MPMESPFPGMDPFLEDPALWPGFHTRLITAAAEQLQPRLRERGFYVDINERVWLSEGQRAVHPDVAVMRNRSTHSDAGSPRPSGRAATLEADEPVLVHAFGAEYREAYIEVFDRDGHKLVTSIEFLSPANKSPGKGSDLYLAKQAELVASGVSLVEIDLLRGGAHTVRVPIELVEPLRPWHYLISITRAQASDFEVDPLRLQDRLPRIRIPLRANDADAVLDLQATFLRAYATGPYPERVDYATAPKPPLGDEDVVWVHDVIRGTRGQF